MIVDQRSTKIVQKAEALPVILWLKYIFGLIVFESLALGIPDVAARLHTPASMWNMDGHSDGRRSHVQPLHKRAVPQVHRLFSAQGTSTHYAPAG